MRLGSHGRAGKVAVAGTQAHAVTPSEDRRLRSELTAKARQDDNSPVSRLPLGAAFSGFTEL